MHLYLCSIFRQYTQLKSECVFIHILPFTFKVLWYLLTNENFFFWKQTIYKPLGQPEKPNFSLQPFLCFYGLQTFIDLFRAIVPYSVHGDSKWQYNTACDDHIQLIILILPVWVGFCEYGNLLVRPSALYLRHWQLLTSREDDEQKQYRILHFSNQNLQKSRRVDSTFFYFLWLA